MKILGIAGSLRKDSFNRQLLERAAKQLDEEHSLTIFELDDVPLYNQDADGDQKPEAAASLDSAIASANALLIATPEYNHSLPGVLKNALDWASRPAFKSALVDKPYGMLSASPSPVGGGFAQEELRRVMEVCLAKGFSHRPIAVGAAHKSLSDEDALEKLDGRLRVYLQAFTRWLEKMA